MLWSTVPSRPVLSSRSRVLVAKSCAKAVPNSKALQCCLHSVLVRQSHGADSHDTTRRRHAASGAAPAQATALIGSRLLSCSHIEIVLYCIVLYCTIFRPPIHMLRPLGARSQIGTDLCHCFTVLYSVLYCTCTALLCQR